jgi:endonuclease/exonuclease/phosphatase family metal-dependent hydrolase
MDRRRSPERILDVIGEVDADIVLLQEADHRLGGRPAALTRAEVLARGDHVVLDHSLNATSLGWHGQAVLVRRGWPVLRTQRIALPGLEPRGAILAEIPTGAGPLRVVGVHLGLIRRYRLLQLAAIRAALSRHPPMPTVIAGDYNEWSPQNGTAPLLSDFHVHVPGRSYPSLRPIGPLDRIAVGMGAHLVEAGVHVSALSRVASDHLPVWATLRLGPAAG